MLLCAAVFVCAWACVRESLGDRKEDREAVRGNEGSVPVDWAS